MIQCSVAAGKDDLLIRVHTGDSLFDIADRGDVSVLELIAGEYVVKLFCLKFAGAVAALGVI